MLYNNHKSIQTRTEKLKVEASRFTIKLYSSGLNIYLPLFNLNNKYFA